MGQLQRNGHRHRDDLRCHNFVRLPPEAVIPAVPPDHGRGRDSGNAVALQTRRIGAHGTRQEHHPAGRRVSLAYHFLLVLVVAKRVDHVRLPVHRAVPEIGRVQGGFFVGVVGIRSLQVPEALGGGEGRHGLRQKARLVRLQRHQQRLDLGGRISSRGHRRLHHQPRLLGHLRAGVPLQEFVGHVSRHRQTGAEYQHKDQIEFQK